MYTSHMYEYVFGLIKLVCIKHKADFIFKAFRETIKVNIEFQLIRGLPFIFRDLATIVLQSDN